MKTAIPPGLHLICAPIRCPKSLNANTGLSSMNQSSISSPPMPSPLIWALAWACLTVLSARAADPKPNDPSAPFGFKLPAGFKLPSTPAPTNGPECKPLLDAFRALHSAPRFHTFWTKTTVNGAATHGDEIATEETYYFRADHYDLSPKSNNVWGSLPITLAHRKTMSHEGGDFYGCHVERQESIDGQLTDVYSFHTYQFRQGGLPFDSEHADGHMWIVRGSGLPLRFELVTPPEPEDQPNTTRHIEMHVTYTNVQPPTGVK
jgi:hypothetical protein